MLIPRQYDGLGLDTVTYLLALEQISAVDASVGVLMSVHNSLPTQMLLRYGSDEQKERFLKPMARGDMLGAFALSEPDAGSDASALRTQAVRDGDDWVLTGTKAWVTNGNTADVIVAMARTDSAGDRRGARGIGAFIVTPDLPGFGVGKKEDKMGLRASPTVQLSFDELRVPAENLLGDPVAGLHLRHAGAGQRPPRHRRAGHRHRRRGARPRGGVRRRAEAVRAAHPRPPGHPVQARRHGGARAVGALAALRGRRRRRIAASRSRSSRSMAKLACSEAAMCVTTDAVQVFGGYGYVKDYPVERLFRDAKVTEIYEGTSEIQRIVIARELYGRDTGGRST